MALVVLKKSRMDFLLCDVSRDFVVIGRSVRSSAIVTTLNQL